jgi:hypothetical protein
MHGLDTLKVFRLNTALCHFVQRYTFRSKTIIIRHSLQIFQNQGKILLFAGSLEYYKIFVTIKVQFLTVYRVSGRLCNQLAVFLDSLG